MSATETGQYSSLPSIYSDEPQDPEIEAFRKYQSQIPNLSKADVAKTIVQSQKYGVLSTLSIQDGITGFPVGSTVEYAPDEAGRPLFCFSSQSAHSKDLQKCPKASLQVQVPYFENLSDGRVCIVGNISRIEDSEQATSKEQFMKTHPDSFWVQFGDFGMYKMEKVIKARFIGGFGQNKWLDGEEYEAAISDPVNKFSAAISKQINEDDSDQIIKLVKHFAGINVQNVTLQSIDRLGMVVVCERDGEKFKCRLGFPEEILTHEQARDVIDTMIEVACAKGEQVQ